jgi:hypothetical protein
MNYCIRIVYIVRIVYIYIYCINQLKYILILDYR